LKTKKRRTKHYTLLLIPDNERKTRTWKINAKLLLGLIFFLLLVGVLIIFGFATYWKVAKLAVDSGQIQQENVKLKESLARVDEIQTNLDKLRKIDQKLRSSLTGYVGIVENSQQQQEMQIAVTETNVSGRDKFDRSIFRSIPDIYPVDGFITRGFETNPALGIPHYAIDIAASKGSPVKATADGVVMFSGWTYDEGFVIILKHKFDFYSFYKHNQVNLCMEFEQVEKGQVIALLGDTGQISSGPHLHFEVWEGLQPVDPLNFLRNN
jgi:murein DD-endopeptidase MepM/ murein hydrolase activator NlpD